MKLLLLSDHLSSHTEKWAKALANRHVEIVIFSLSQDAPHNFSEYPNIKVICENFNPKTTATEHTFRKSFYLFALFRLNQTIKTFNPDVVHAHYASSYGLLGALTGFHPFIISVWGSDVYTFPSNFLKSALLKFNLGKADQILSTSHAMAAETKKYTSKHIEITPFGIDVEAFKPMAVKSIFQPTDFVIGTVKAMEDVYGIDVLIRAFALLKKALPNDSLKLLLVGKGTKMTHLQSLTASLGLEEEVVFTGAIGHEEVPKYLNMLDVYVALSHSESFGVSVLEASACGLPVLVSRVGGLPEVVQEGQTGLIVSPANESEACEALVALRKNEEGRNQMGLAGRQRVLDYYNFENNLDQMMDIYNTHLKS